MPKTTRVSCQEARKDMVNPPTSTTLCDNAMLARSPVRALIVTQSCERRLANAPAVRSGDMSNQPTCCRRIALKAMPRTWNARFSVTTAKQYCRSIAPKEATAPMLRKTIAQTRAWDRISSTSGLKKTTMNSAIRKPMAGIVVPVSNAPSMPPAKCHGFANVSRQSHFMEMGLCFTASSCASRAAASPPDFSEPGLQPTGLGSMSTSFVAKPSDTSIADKSTAPWISSPPEPSAPPTCAFNNAL